MSPEEIRNYVDNRVMRSKRSLEEVDVLAGIKHYNTAISRLYYALYYSVTALLLKMGFTSKTHEGAQRQFSRELVKSGIIDKRFSKVYSAILQLRQVGDYGELRDLTDDDLSKIRPEVEELINHVMELLK